MCIAIRRTLLDGFHDTVKDMFRCIVIIQIQRFLECYGQQRARLPDSDSLLFESPPEPSDHDRNHDGLVLLYDVRRSFSAWSVGFGGSLGEGNDPTVIQGPFDFPGIRGIQSPSDFLSTLNPGALHGDRSGQRIHPGDPIPGDGLLGRYEVYVGVRAQQVPWKTQPVFPPPL
jgi:hypothetical protein